MNTTTNSYESDRYFVAMANERIARGDLAGARSIARQARAARGEGTTLQRVASRLHLRRNG